MSIPEPGLREKILSTSKNLFIQHGYLGLSMRQIAESLNVSKPALYYYFKDKEELFLTILILYLREIEQILDQITTEPTSYREKLIHFVEYVLTQPSDQRSIIRLASQEMKQLSDPARNSFEKIYQEKFIGKIEAILKSGMSQGEFRSIKPEVATWTLLGMIYPYFDPAHAGNGNFSVEIMQQIITVYMDGIGL